MPTTISQTEPKPKAPRRQPRRISKEQFLRDYSDKEDGYKYEWNNGVVEKTKAMNQQQAILQAVFFRHFINTQTFKGGGLFTTETDMDTSPSHFRRPDLAIYTGEQVRLMKKGENQVAPWLAEIISPTDNADKINEKLEEYFRAGVQVVWHIFPTSKKVDVFTSPDDVTICRGKTVCSGAPALPDFQIPAEALFA
ncbi:MAG: Uma2 family endonuclease [Saprospiraceae bacterium]|nr:MAG: Uma2 family endonuclease [Saprospiraceae bacterium]